MQSFPSFFFSYLSDRLQYTTKGTKALRLLGDGGGKHNNDAQQDQTFNPKESVLIKNPTRGNPQRRLLLKNGEVNISRYVYNYFLLVLISSKISYQSSIKSVNKNLTFSLSFLRFI